MNHVQPHAAPTRWKAREGRLRRRPGARRAHAGFGVIEVLIATSVLLVAAVLASGALLSSLKVTDTHRERAMAAAAVRAMLEELIAADFATVFARYNGDPSDDPVGVTSPGNTFQIDGLSPASDDADGIVGEIVFPVAVGAPGQLREDVVNGLFGSATDLNGDEVIDGSDHSLDYLMLPVEVNARWIGPGGPQEIRIHTLLAEV